MNDNTMSCDDIEDDEDSGSITRLVTSMLLFRLCVAWMRAIRSVHMTMAGHNVAGYEYPQPSIRRNRTSKADGSRKQPNNRGSEQFTNCILTLHGGSSVRDVPVGEAPLAEQGRAIKRIQMPLCWR